MSRLIRPVTVYDLLKAKEKENINHIPTLSPGLDQILGGILNYKSKFKFNNSNLKIY